MDTGTRESEQGMSKCRPAAASDVGHGGSQVLRGLQWTCFSGSNVIFSWYCGSGFVASLLVGHVH